MLVAQISDTHIAGPDQKTCGVAPMAENLARCVANINALSVKPDVVLLSGDVTNSASRSEARHAAQILSQLEAPLFLVPGNHDDRNVLRDIFGGKAIPSGTSGDFINYVIEGFPIRIIAIDSVETGKSGGNLCQARMDWLRECLKQGGDQPTLVFMHHPPLKLGVPETDIDGFSGSQGLGEIVAAYPNIERILCGHIHLQTHTRWNGTIVTTAPSMGMQLTFDLRQSETSEFMLSDPAYLLHRWTDNKKLVTYSIALSSLPGPYSFDEGQL